MRKFKLINSLGREFDLMRKDAFFSSPDGLGFDMDFEYSLVGIEYQIVETESKQKEPSGEIVFKNYTVFQEFAKFISSQPLKLAYSPIKDKWYYLDCTIQKFEKSEIERSGRLICPINFIGTSKWYVHKISNRTVSTNEDAKKYPYQYPYKYADSINGVIEINNEGFEECPCIIHIFGEITNPTWSLVVNNDVISSGAVTAVISKGNKLVINSKDNEQRICEYTNDNEFIRNLYQVSDFSTDRFIYLPTGKSKLLIAGNVASDIEAYCEVIEIYETV